jgi:hypothetical protein
MNEITVSEFEKQLSPEVVQARHTLKTGVIPKEAILSHVGKGQKKFDYVSHIWVNEQLRNAFGPLWGYSTGQWEVFEDATVAVSCTLWVDFPTKQGGLLRQTITEIGAWEDLTGKMPLANRVAAAASRGLVRCMMRMFGVGAQFYGSDDIKQPKPWGTLKSLGAAYSISEEEIIDALKDAGIKGDDLSDNNIFIEAYDIVRKLCGLLGEEELPDDLK